VSRGCEVVAPAKINLYLAIGDKRPDGYHDVCTVLHTLELADTVCVSEASSESFECFPSMGLAPADNLAFCARQAMARASVIITTCRFELSSGSLLVPVLVGQAVMLLLLCQA